MINFKPIGNNFNDPNIFEVYKSKLSDVVSIVLIHFRNALGDNNCYRVYINNNFTEASYFKPKYFEANDFLSACQRVPYYLQEAMEQEEKAMHNRHEKFKRLINKADEELVSVLEE